MTPSEFLIDRLSSMGAAVTLPGAGHLGAPSPGFNDRS